MPDSTVAYARAWDRVLAEWDVGRLELLYPPSHMMPYLALVKFNMWSTERGETKQHELIGMSSGRKDTTTKILNGRACCRRRMSALQAPKVPEGCAVALSALFAGEPPNACTTKHKYQVSLEDHCHPQL
eukprot:SAG22_NODE_42_length_25431_cov_5.091580_6_plen_128_part_01